MTDSQDFRWPFLYRAVFAAVALLVGAFYLWSVQAANPPFEWHYDKSGYYDLLARGFAAGHLYLPLDPPPQMLALRDPLNLQKSGEWALQDAALYRNHYYLYHGVTPALLAFLPWRLLFHHDLPESFAAFIFCLVGFLFSGATLLTMLSWARYRPPLWLWGLALLALGVSQPAPFLLQRVFVYEIAIASGYAFLSAGLWFLARGLSSAKRSPLMMAVSGLCFGLSVGCRPHLAIFGLCAALAVLWCGTGDFGFREMLRSRGLLGYCVAFGACLLAVLWYNYARFEDRKSHV